MYFMIKDADRILDRLFILNNEQWLEKKPKATAHKAIFDLRITFEGRPYL